MPNERELSVAIGVDLPSNAGSISLAIPIIWQGYMPDTLSQKLGIFSKQRNRLGEHLSFCLVMIGSYNRLSCHGLLKLSMS